MKLNVYFYSHPPTMNGKILSVTLIPALVVAHPHVSSIWCDTELWEFPGMLKDDK